MNIKLSVIAPVPSCKLGQLVMHVFNVKAEQSLEWFKAHADEMARQFLPGVNYVALNVEAA